MSTNRVAPLTRRNQRYSRFPGVTPERPTRNPKIQCKPYLEHSTAGGDHSSSFGRCVARRFVCRTYGARSTLPYPHFRLRVRSPSVWANLWSRLRRLGPQYISTVSIPQVCPGEDRNVFQENSLMRHGIGTICRGPSTRPHSFLARTRSG